MLLTTSKPVACGIPPAIGANYPNSKVSKVTMMNRQALPPLQILARSSPIQQCRDVVV
ncbi:hypothetical protein OROGR_010321 [Orobanche gracilis]